MLLSTNFACHLVVKGIYHALIAHHLALVINFIGTLLRTCMVGRFPLYGALLRFPWCSRNNHDGTVLEKLICPKIILFLILGKAKEYI